MIVARNHRIVLGVTGGIAAYKTPSLVRLFQKNSVEVKVVCTRAALMLVAQQALSVVSGHTVYVDEPARDFDMAHVSLAKWGDFLLVCPATADTIAKIAHGIADNLLTTLALSFEKRLVIAPAMNTAMWLNRATQENVALLTGRGAFVLPVDEGDLACGDTGPGRLLAPETIVDFILSLASPRCLADKKVLVSSGPTHEPIDAVRYIGNRSSGKMGAALARAAMLAGARVTLVSGPSPTPPPPGVRLITVTTAAEMLAVLEKEFDETDVCIMAAAVADFRPARRIEGKKHRDHQASWDLTFVPNPDIAEHLGGRKTRQFLACFSLETGDDLASPLEKMKRKKCDLMIINTTDASLELDSTEVRIVLPDASVEHLPRQSKKSAAAHIIERIAQHLGVFHG